jgi:hypothetical protein
MNHEQMLAWITERIQDAPDEVLAAVVAALQPFEADQQAELRPARAYQPTMSDRPAQSVATQGLRPSTPAPKTSQAQPYQDTRGLSPETVARLRGQSVATLAETRKVLADFDRRPQQFSEVRVTRDQWANTFLSKRRDNPSLTCEQFLASVRPGVPRAAPAAAGVAKFSELIETSMAGAHWDRNRAFFEKNHTPRAEYVNSYKYALKNAPGLTHDAFKRSLHGQA